MSLFLGKYYIALSLLIEIWKVEKETEVLFVEDGGREEQDGINEHEPQPHVLFLYVCVCLRLRELLD